jgi:hypothetical protein
MATKCIAEILGSMCGNGQMILVEHVGSDLTFPNVSTLPP